MRLLHTSDWHAGRSLARHSLDPGLVSALTEMGDFAVKEKVDAVIVAGDIFETPRPTGDSQAIVFDFFLRLFKHGIPAVLVAGNHDSYGHWSALEPLLRLANVHVVARPSLESVFMVDTPSGCLEVAGLAWPSERMMAPLVGALGGEDERKTTWMSNVTAFIRHLCGQLQDRGPRLFVGHLMLEGSEISNTQRQLTISDCYWISASALPDNLNYVALGHVHVPQTRQAPSRTAYSGAPRPMDFGEAGQPRGFYRVDLERGKFTETEFIGLSCAQPLRELQVNSSRLADLEAHRGQSGFFKVVVRLEQPEPNLAGRVREILPSALIVKSLVSATTVSKVRDTQSLHDPAGTFREFYATRFPNQPVPDELERAFASLYQEVTDAPA